MFVQYYLRHLFILVELPDLWRYKISDYLSSELKPGNLTKSLELPAAPEPDPFSMVE